MSSQPSLGSVQTVDVALVSTSSLPSGSKSSRAAFLPGLPPPSTQRVNSNGCQGFASEKRLFSLFLPQIPERKQLSIPKIESPEGYYEEAEPYDTSLNGTSGRGSPGSLAQAENWPQSTSPCPGGELRSGQTQPPLEGRDGPQSWFVCPVLLVFPLEVRWLRGPVPSGARAVWQAEPQPMSRVLSLD